MKWHGGLVSFLLLFAFAAAAEETNVLSQIELENRLAHSALEVIRPMDSFATVRVQLRYKDVAESLPGYAGGAGATTVRATWNIREVLVQVRTQLAPVPDWLKGDLEEAVALSSARVRVEFQTRAPEAVLALEAAQRRHSVESSWLHQLESRWTKGEWPFGRSSALWLVGAFTAFCLVAAGYVAWLMNRQSRSHRRLVQDTLVPALRAGASATPHTEARPVTRDAPVEATPTAKSGAAHGHDLVRELPPEALTALLADCYWTKRDDYGHDVWSRMSVTQRRAVMDAGFVDANYFRHVLGVAATPCPFVDDPWYLKPECDVSRSSSDEILTWLRAKAGRWKLLGQFRRESLAVPLADLLRFEAAPASSPLENERPKASALRMLDSVASRRLGTDDDAYLFEHAAQIPPSMAAALSSLAWVALLPLEDRRKLLDTFPARELAEAWVGAEPVLQALREALPKAKLELIESYVRQSAPDRGAESFQRLSDAGYRAWSQTGARLRAA